MPGSKLADGEWITTGPRGSIELSGQRLPVRVTRIEFGAWSRGELAAELHLALVLGAIGCADADVALPCTLALGGVRVLGDIALLAGRPPTRRRGWRPRYSTWPTMSSRCAMAS